MCGADTALFRDMADRLPGHAYLESLTVEGGCTHVLLRHSTGEMIRVAIPTRPSLSTPPKLDPHSVLAVHVRQGHAVECVALLKAGRGARRMNITMSHAMALAQSGAHTVFMTESPGPNPLGLPE